MTTGTINPDGVDLVVFSAGVDLPETGHCRYEMAVHEDGAPCSPECGCVPVEDRTTIWEGTAITRGEWTWHADRYVLIGVRSTGPTKPELRERVAELEEALAADLYLIADLRTQLCGEGMERRALESSVRQLCCELYPLKQELPWLRGSAATGWGLSLVLAVALVWAVIA